MLDKLNTYITDNKKKIIFFIIAMCLSILVAGSISKFGLLGPLCAIAIAASGTFLVYAVKNPRLAFWAYFAYCFCLGFLVKSFLQVPVGLALEALLLLTWCSILINMDKFNWQNIKNEHVILSLIWFGISFLQILNPYGGSIVAWFNELRFVALNWLLISPLVFLIFNSRSDLNKFIIFIFLFSFLACLYGVKQLYFGLTSGEQQWMGMGNEMTHIIKGKLRVFSIYSDAGQFGASQAIMAVISLALLIGPFSFGKKIIIALFTFVFLYGMAISGTRGALFALAAGVASALFLSKNFKVLFVGILLCGSGFFILKYTTIGENIFQISRLRSALNPEDASFKVRLDNQKKLKSILKDLPFGAGLGMSGMNGITHNSDKVIANIPPDSYWVKVWVMYGVVGLIFWFAITSYIIGKCSGIVWKIQDPGLKAKMIALTAGTVACFICSYGNEVMNGMPSSVIMFMSWSFVYIAPWLDKKLNQTEPDGNNHH
ncbi:O-antigen ligase family protein [Pedobacter sp. MR22-3]|uniref:O-antigen ligase family protein n=1 Tax=Pedobacter sp. MR22-3 TaxID=2994552 RepID=UPI00224814AF|nr:O-antigen ligase family protein [Pedobacter sp. MR22-3]MCX2583713.1 O-antigen ligase family protein [Pedobacter sp. MR22-3]